MAICFLSKSRHGSVFYFRRRVPDDIRRHIGKPYLVKSLRTCERRTLIDTQDLVVKMIDWVTAIIPCHHSQKIYGGRVASVTPDGEIEWQVEKKQQVPGSYEAAANCGFWLIG